jgi:hypothetical protein
LLAHAEDVDQILGLSLPIRRLPMIGDHPGTLPLGQRGFVGLVRDLVAEVVLDFAEDVVRAASGRVAPPPLRVVILVRDLLRERAESFEGVSLAPLFVDGQRHEMCVPASWASLDVIGLQVGRELHAASDLLGRDLSGRGVVAGLVRQPVRSLDLVGEQGEHAVEFSARDCIVFWRPAVPALAVAWRPISRSSGAMVEAREQFFGWPTRPADDPAPGRGSAGLERRRRQPRGSPCGRSTQELCERTRWWRRDGNLVETHRILEDQLVQRLLAERRFSRRMALCLGVRPGAVEPREVAGPQEVA